MFRLLGWLITKLLKSKFRWFLIWIVVVVLVSQIMAGGMVLFGSVQDYFHDKAQLQRFPTPVTMTVQEFIRLQPKEGWFRITEVTTDAMDAAFTDNGSDIPASDGTGTVRKFMVPIYTPKIEDDAPAKAVLISDHLLTRKVINELAQMGQGVSIDPDEENSQENHPPKVSNAKLEKWVLKNADRIFETRTVEGMIRPVNELSSSDQKIYDSLGKDIAPNAVVLEEGITPRAEYESSSGAALGVLFGASILFLIVVAGVVIALRRQAAPAYILPPIPTESNLNDRKRRIEE